MPRLKGLSRESIWLLAVISLEYLAVLGLTLQTIIVAGSWATSGDIQFYGIILLVAASFFVYFGFNGVIKENPVELMAFNAANFLMAAYILYSLFYPDQNPIVSDTGSDTGSDDLDGWMRGLMADNHTTVAPSGSGSGPGSQPWYKVATAVTWVRAGLVLVLWPLVVLLSYKVYEEFGWRTHKLLNTTDPGAILRFKRYQTFISFLKLDFEAGALTIALGSFYLYSSIHTWVIIASILVTFGWPLLGAASAKFESKGGMLLVLGAAPIEPAYVMYKIYEFYKDPDQFSDVREYVFAMIAMGTLAVGVRVCSVGFAVAVWNGFGYGLGETLQAVDSPLLTATTATTGSRGLTPPPFKFAGERRSYGSS